MAGGAQPERGGIIGGINVTPLVDITLVLLIIFIVTAKVIVNPAVPVDLPEAAKTEEVKLVFSLIVPTEGDPLVDGERVPSDEELVRRAREALGRDPELRAVIHADGNAAHRRVLHVLDLLKTAGVSHVAFAAVPLAEAPP